MSVWDRIEIARGDITTFEVDAIVNAANSSLMGGGGVDGAIHRAAGPQLKEELKRIRREQYPDGLPPGQAVITKGYNLPAKYVIHTVGPIWRGGNHNEDEILASAYRNSLKIASERKFDTVAFPSISTGAYRFPVERAAKIALKTIADFLSQNEYPRKVIMVLYDEPTYDVYKRTYEELSHEQIA
ncbi:MAG: O-acetyl-ADP-ribose deacetylase [Chlorobi bacterium]|nr:O-acetyl-ADP-ribose deacetylase [Chlorobiota bacterium]